MGEKKAIHPSQLPYDLKQQLSAQPKHLHRKLVPWNLPVCHLLPSKSAHSQEWLIIIEFGLNSFNSWNFQKYQFGSGPNKWWGEDEKRKKRQEGGLIAQTLNRKENRLFTCLISPPILKYNLEKGQQHSPVLSFWVVLFASSTFLHAEFSNENKYYFC